jgi:uncharacterized membrane protein YeiH
VQIKDIFVAIGMALFSAMGAVVKFLNIKDKRRQKIFTLTSEVISAAFAGLLVFLLFRYLNLNVYIAFALAGVGGNTGSKFIDMLGRFIAVRSGVNVDADTQEGDQP